MAAQSLATMHLAPMPPHARVVVEQAALERQREARIYSQTRGMMSYRTERMFAHALRDYQRENHAPMKRTRPPLHMRRYSIDVNTGVEERGRKRVSHSLTAMRSCESLQHLVNSDVTNNVLLQTRDGKLIETEVLDQQVSQFPSYSPEYQTHPGPCMIANNAKLTTIQAHQRKDNEFKHQALELVTPSTAPLLFPIPCRYHGFNKYYRYLPPSNSSTYLSIDNASLTNADFLTITHLTGYHSFMSDNALDTAFTLLSREKACSAADIRIASTIEAQVSFYADPAGKEAYSALFSPARWIFIPINDGLGATSNDSALAAGAHWMLVALDRVHKRMHYFDSLAMGRGEYWDTAIDVARGMLGIVGEDEAQWAFVAEWHSPHQYRDNACQQDVGPCGPFVYAMVSLFVDEIRGFQRAGVEEQCDLSLGGWFPAWFGERWDSKTTREEIQRSVASARMQSSVEGWAAAHDRVALEGEQVEVVDEPAVRFRVPRWDTGTDQPDGSEDSEGSDATAGSDESVGSEVAEVSSDDEDEKMTSVEHAASPESGTSPTNGDGDVAQSVQFTIDDVVIISSDEVEEIFFHES